MVFLFAIPSLGDSRGAVVNDMPGENADSRCRGQKKRSRNFRSRADFASMSLYGEERKRHCGKAVVRAATCFAPQRGRIPAYSTK